MSFNQNADRKKFLMERMAYNIEAYQQDLTSQKQRFETFVEKHMTDHKGRINLVLTGLGIVLTAAALVTGIKAFNGIQSMLYEMLIILTLISIVILAIALFIFAIFKRKTLDQLLKIDNAYQEIQGREDVLKGFFAERIFYINSVTIPQWYAISRIIILLYGHRFELASLYDKASESFF